MLRIVACIAQDHNLWLVALAALLCALGAAATFVLVRFAGRETDAFRCKICLAVAAVVAGFSIWATHFVAMLAYEPGVAHAYDPGVTFLSLAAAIVICGAALAFARSSTGAIRVVAGATFGVGVATMHFTGMAAYRIGGQIQWDWALVATAILAGAGFGAMGLWYGFRADAWRNRAVGVLSLVLAIAGHHFTAMAAITVVPDREINMLDNGLAPWSMAVLVAFVALTMMLAAVGFLYVDNLRRIHAQERVLDAAIANMSDGLMMYDGDEKVVAINKRVAELYEDPQREVAIGMRFREVLRLRAVQGTAPEDVEGHRAEILQKLRRDGTLSRVVQTHAGRFLDITYRMNPAGGWVTTLRDVTERETQRKDIETARAVLDTAISNMNDGLIMYDANERVIAVNARILEVSDLPAGSVKPGMTFREVLGLRKLSGAIKDVEEHRVKLLARLRSEGAVTTTADAANGRTIEMNFRSLKDGGWIATIRDVSELARQRKILSSALENMSEGLVMFDAQERLVAANKQYARNYSLPVEAIEPGTTLLELMQARAKHGNILDDPNERRQRILDQLEEKGEFISKVATPNGRYFENVVKQLGDGGFIVTQRDLTESMRQQKQVESSRAFLEAVIENAPVAITVKSARELKYTLVNRAAEQFFGVGRDHFIGNTLSAVQTVEQVERIERNDRDCIESGRTAIFLEQRIVTPVGDSKITNQIKFAIRDADGAPTHVLSLFEDVTERVLQRREIESAHAFLEKILENVPSPILVKKASDMTYKLVNQAAEEFLGLDRTKMIGVPASAFLPLESARKIDASDAVALQSSDITVLPEQESPTPGNGKRIVIQKKIAIHGANGLPEYLLTLIDDVTEKRRTEAQLAYMAHHDSLTGLPNRALFAQHLTQAISRMKRRDEKFAVLSLDLDRFKQVNDTLGHQFGDLLLREVARRVRETIRDTDTAARFGGDEFVVLQADANQPEGAAHFAPRLVEALCAPYEIEGQRVLIGASVGIAISPDNGDTPDELLRNADLALYRAKAEGKGTFRLFATEMDDAMQERRTLELEMRDALANNEFEVYFQPLVDLRTGSIAACETLVRWRHPTRGFVSPGDFIPLAEETGMIVRIGEIVLRKACNEATKWPAHTRVAVNLSAVQFRNGDLVATVNSALADAGLAADRLELEITESILIHDKVGVLAILEKFRDLGIHISLDDFGTGYSSLAYLSSFPFDKIKIDRSFVQNVASRPDSAAIIRAITGLASTLGMCTTAEGVESGDELEWLRAHGCKEVQGFFFSPPVSARDLSELMQSGPMDVGLIAPIAPPRAA